MIRPKILSLSKLIMRVPSLVEVVKELRSYPKRLIIRDSSYWTLHESHGDVVRGLHSGQPVAVGLIKGKLILSNKFITPSIRIIPCILRRDVITLMIIRED